MRFFRPSRGRWTTVLGFCALVCAVTATAQHGTAPSGHPASAAKLQFYLRVTPPRPTFSVDMSPQEHDVIEEDGAYWIDLFKAGKVLLIGPVHDPKGIFGLVILEVDSEAEAHKLADNEPSVKAGINKVEVIPMHVFVRKP